MKKYCIYVVNSNIDKFKPDEIDYHKVVSNSYYGISGDNFSTLLLDLLHMLNTDTASDQDYYFLADEINKTIINDKTWER